MNDHFIVYFCQKWFIYSIEIGRAVGGIGISEINILEGELEINILEGELLVELWISEINIIEGEPVPIHTNFSYSNVEQSSLNR